MSKIGAAFISVLLLALVLCGCGKEEITEVDVTENIESTDVIDYEENNASNAHIDFEALKNENDEIFAWLQIPGTDINTPILQSTESDDFYKNHDVKKNSDDNGTAYIEMPVRNDMCDFNTVVLGSNGIFGELANFGNPDFFENHENFYIYLDGNVLTYEVFASYERENNSLIRQYSFAEAVSDRQFLNDLYNSKIVGKQIREGWDELNEYNFLVTLTLTNPDSDKQFVVLGVLINDAAGTIDREIIEELNIGPSLLESY